MKQKKIEKAIDELLVRFSGRSNQNRPLIAGIDGLGGAGKTTAAGAITDALNELPVHVTTIHLDDHIVDRKERYDTGHEEWFEYYHLQWDVEKLAHHLFEPLAKGCTGVTLPFYDKISDRSELRQISFRPAGIVLIEGIFLQRPEWQRYYDVIIYVDCPDAERSRRVLARDSYIGDPEARYSKYERRYWPGEKHYVETVKPAESAHLVL